MCPQRHNSKSVHILLVEDDPGHARLIEKSLRRARVSNAIDWVDNGQQALDFLHGEGKFAGRPRPDHLLIMLDVNMPVMDGCQLLKHIKGDPGTQHIPVVMLTSTDDEREIAHCYQLGCNIYITKPIDYEDFSRAIAELGMFVSVMAVPA